MEKQKNNSKLYRNFIIYLILEMATFFLIYFLFSSTISDIHTRRLIVIPLLILIFLASSIFILYLLKKVFILSRKYDKIEMELLKYQYLESDLKLYRQHRHDMKNHLMVIYELVETENYEDLMEYTKEYMNKTSKKLFNIETGADEIDLLLHNKFDIAKDDNITIEYHCKANIIATNNSMIDLISIFSNLIDNAVEANSRIDNPRDRMLSVSIDEDQIDYIFVITNAFVSKHNTSSFTKDGFTTKSDKKNHGLGLGIIDKLVSKYDGQSSIEVFNDVFYQVKIEIPKHLL